MCSGKWARGGWAGSDEQELQVKEETQVSVGTGDRGACLSSKPWQRTWAGPVAIRLLGLQPQLSVRIHMACIKACRRHTCLGRCVLQWPSRSMCDSVQPASTICAVKLAPCVGLTACLDGAQALQKPRFRHRNMSACVAGHYPLLPL